MVVQQNGLRYIKCLYLHLFKCTDLINFCYSLTWHSCLWIWGLSLSVVCGLPLFASSSLRELTLLRECKEIIEKRNFLCFIYGHGVQFCKSLGVVMKTSRFLKFLWLFLFNKLNFISKMALKPHPNNCRAYTMFVSTWTFLVISIFFFVVGRGGGGGNLFLL